MSLSSCSQPLATSGARAFVLRRLGRHLQGLTFRDLLLSSPFSQSQIRGALRELVDTMQVTQCGTVYVKLD
mgnify:CR=1 FL=1